MNEDFCYKKPEFSSQEIFHLSLIESSLEKICKEFGFELEEQEGTPVRGRRGWQRGFGFDFKGDHNHLFFNVSYDDKGLEPEYWVAGGGYYPDSVFLNLVGINTEDIDLAKKSFVDLVESARKQELPEKYLKPRNVWVNNAPPIFKAPSGLNNPELVWFRNFREFKLLDSEFHLLSVVSDYDYGFNLEKTVVKYGGRELVEEVEINKGKIVDVRNSYSDRKKANLRKELGIVIPSPREDIEKWWDMFISGNDKLPKPETRNYRQIKSFENKLKEIPAEDIREDLKTIYRSSGFVGKRYFFINGLYRLRDFIEEK